MTPMASENSAPARGGSCQNIVARPLVPPTVTPSSVIISEDSLTDTELDDFHLEEAVGSILREVESLRKSSAFPELDSFGVIDQKHDTYLGPTMESNWVLPGKLLVGAYPASMNDSHHAHLLCTILLQGVSTFVCLQQEYRAHGVTEAMWRSGEALRPYFQDVLQLLRKLRELKAADPRAVPAISAPDATDFVHFPIVDCNVADDTKVLQLAARLAARVARGEVLYLHCWGGHGRTGTVVSIMLNLMYDLSAEEAMERCQHVHDVRRIPINVGSPQTEAQREQVRRVVCRLERRSARVAAAAVAAATRAAMHLKQQSSNIGSGENSVFSAIPVDGEKAICRQGAGLGARKTEIGAAVAGRKQSSAGGGGGALGAGAVAVVGGRRGWVRGRRQAFAQAPNGVGEDVSGWLAPTEEEGHGAGLAASGFKSCVEHEDSGVDAAEITTRAGRRKSFGEPGFSQEDTDAARGGGGRATRLRRKSAPGQSPRSAEVDGFSKDAGEDEQQEGVEQSPGLSSSGGGGTGASASPVPCKSVERCVTRSCTGGESHHACVREPGIAKCGGRRLQ